MKYDRQAVTRSIYIHWPFCTYKCDYCSFVSFAKKNDLMEKYNLALCSEINDFFEDYKHGNVHLETIFIGGGTPSTWPDDLLLDTFGKLNSDSLLSKMIPKNASSDFEFSIEVNPATVRAEQFEIFKEIGVNRFSIGVQALDDNILKSLNRHHTVDDVKSLLHLAQKYFDNISIDLIVGLPGVSFDAWKSYLHQVVSWPIKHVSIYFLTIYENTVLYKKIETGQISLISDEDLVDQYNWAVEFLSKHGFCRYEISNFAISGFESKHNKIYWERKPYKGFGLSACSFDGTCRFGNIKSLDSYIEKIEKDVFKDKNTEDKKIISDKKIINEGLDLGGEFFEILDFEQVRMEQIMLGLRTEKGISREKLFHGFSAQQVQELEVRVLELKNKNFLYEKDGNLIISPCFLTIENEIVLELLGKYNI